MARSRRAGVDPVTSEIILGAFETICYEMATHVSLTATTPILNQSNERNATILDGRGRLAALSVGIQQFMLSSTLPVRFALDFFRDEGMHEGDVFVANDPYHGGGHLPDYNVFAPVLEARTATCPQGHTVRGHTAYDRQRRKQLEFIYPRSTCEVCPLFARCVRAKKMGRTLTTHRYEVLWQAARARQQGEEFKLQIMRQ